MSEPIIEDILNNCEKSFAFPELLKSDYFQKYQRGYYSSREQGLLSWHRNYINLLTFLDEIHGYNEQHAKSFVKRLREQEKNWKQCEAIFSEIIVYRYYIRAAYEGLIKKLELDTRECDIIIERLDGSKAYLEVFCVMPDFPSQENSKVMVKNIKTHTQTEMASIRQKLLIGKKKQLSKLRENYAVIELNDPTIAGDFAVLSSLSGGYTTNINKETMQIESSGYNWENSIFEDESTKRLKAIIYFDLGNYDSRRLLFNPNFSVMNNRVEPMP